MQWKNEVSERNFFQLDDSLLRIDQFLSDRLKISRRRACDLLSSSIVFLNGKAVKRKSTRLSGGDKVVLFPFLFKEKEKRIFEYKLKLSILFEDEDMIIINKPSGIVVHENEWEERKTIVGGLLFLKKNLAKGNEFHRPGLVHRLDKDTSGVMIIAKNSFSFKSFLYQFRHRQIDKIYYALVHGRMRRESFAISLPLGKKGTRIFIDKKKGRSALTEVKVIEKIGNFTLVECKPITGRQHQVRVHLKAAGHPVFNDPLYDNVLKSIDKKKGQYLHSYRISFIHPSDRCNYTFSSKLPAFFEEKIFQLRASK